MAIADSDPRMSQIVIHGGIVYLSGQVDQEATDAEGQTKGKSSQSRHCMKLDAMHRSQQETEPQLWGDAVYLQPETHSTPYPPAHLIF